MSRIIQPDEIKVGDKIRIDRVIEGTVTRVGMDGGVDVDHNRRETKNVRGMVNTITLLDRPVELPTRPGAVVKVDEDSHWFLSASRPFGDLRWTSATGNVFTPDEFRRFLTNTQFLIEVIA